MLHIYTGDGKGKTTCATGLAARAAGCGIKAAVFSFMKNKGSNEEKCLCDKIDFFSSDKSFGFVCNMSENEKMEAAAEFSKLFERAVSLSDVYGIMVLDEIIPACECGLCDIRKLIDFVKQAKCEIVLTGRNAPHSLVSIADYVTEMKCIKHPYENGVMAREGIEY